MTNIAAYLAPIQTFRSFLSSGAPNAYGTVTTYAAGTTTQLATWTDWTATTANTNPTTLNARGEMNMYLLPNTGYKIVEADQYGNLIKTTDQMYNSQLLNLYGGTDTGTVNAYQVSITSPNAGYTNGQIIYFLASNSNTGASTLAVTINGAAQSPVAIINQNGSALTANEILSNNIVEVMYLNGSFLLLQGAQQGLVSYGGTDTGTANNYVVALTNQYFSYTAGNVLFFIPSNNNTGSSVINVKGLGNKSIVQINGNALLAGSLIANQLAELVYNGTSFVLISANSSVTSTFTLATTGFTTVTNPVVTYSVNGNVVTLNFPTITGTSNATTFTLTGMANGLQGVTQAVQSTLIPAIDNSVLGISAYIIIPNQVGGSTIQVQINNSSGNWTASGTKTLNKFSFSYALA